MRAYKLHEVQFASLASLAVDQTVDAGQVGMDGAPRSPSKKDPPDRTSPPGGDAKPTGLRLFAAALYLLATVFLILVEIGNINGHPVIRSTYFLRIDLAHIIPSSVPNTVFINSIAQSIGLHDFYQVGLWNFCEGDQSQGITSCSTPAPLYWFNPVEIILPQMLAGASIALPTDVVNVLDLVRLASAWMFSCFLVGAHLGAPMLAFMWTATGLNLIGFLMQLGTCCGVCCCSGRRKAMNRKSTTEVAASTREKDGPGHEGRTPGAFAFRRRTR